MTKKKIIHFFNHRFNFKNFVDNLFLIIAFSLPLEKIVLRLLLVLFSSTSIFSGDYSVFKKKSSWFKLSITLLWLIPFFQLTILKHLESNFNKLETKLSLIIIPILILIFKKKPTLHKTFKIYIIGCIISCLICIVFSLYNFYLVHIYEVFFYGKLSIFHHPSYYAMYINFAIGLLLFNTVDPFLKFNISKNWSYFLICFLTIVVILLSSRTGWITNLIIQSIFLFYSFRDKGFNPNIIVYISIVLVCYVSIYNIPSLKQRAGELTFKYNPSTKIEPLNYEKNKSLDQPKIVYKPSSTNARKIAWKLSYELINNKLFFGYGTGLSKSELKKLYNDNGYYVLADKELNSHNQFIQFQLDHGLIGSICLLFFTLIMLIISLFEKDYLYALFLIIINLNFMTESMLETQSGVVFFSFFNTLFFYNWVDKKFRKD